MEFCISVTAIEHNTVVAVFFQELDNLVIFNNQEIFVKMEDLMAVTKETSIFGDPTVRRLANMYRPPVSGSPQETLVHISQNTRDHILKFRNL